MHRWMAQHAHSERFLSLGSQIILDFIAMFHVVLVHMMTCRAICRVFAAIRAAQTIYLMHMSNLLLKKVNSSTGN
jgi:hypothetical protein